MKLRFYQSSVITGFLFILLLGGIYLYQFYRDQKFIWSLPQMSAPSSGQPSAQTLECVSYAPFQNNEAPWLLDNTLIPSARVEKDLQLISRYSRCIRIYSITGMEYLPELARQYGLKILFGIWINADPLATELEINRSIPLIKKNADVIEAVIVGNETLLRKEISSKQLIHYINEVKNQLPALPVTYADVWEFWLEYPEVSAAVDYITIHILPYWEDNPVAVSEAITHIEKVFKKVSSVFDKEIKIGETGWPSRGRTRKAAIPSAEYQHYFLTHFLKWAAEKGHHYNLIEAFNQKWKRFNEGTVGGYWGIFHRDMPASAQNTWPDFLERYGLQSRNPVEITLSTVVVIFLVVCTACFGALIKTQSQPPLSSFFRTLIYIHMAVLFLFTTGLVFDSRYREFPCLIFLPSTVMLSFIFYTHHSGKPTHVNISWFFLIFAGVILIQEGFQNKEALIWITMITSLGFSLSGFKKYPAYRMIFISVLAYLAASILRGTLMEAHSIAHFCSEKEASFIFPALCKFRDFIGMLIHYKAFACFSILLLLAHFFLRGTLLPSLALFSSMVGLVLYQPESALPFWVAVTLCEPGRYPRLLTRR